MQLKDTIPPHNLDAEKATLGAILLNSKRFNEVSFLSGDDFFSSQNKEIFESLRSLSLRGVSADLLTLIDELTKNGKLDAAGGAAYISSLASSVPTSANIEYYGQIVRDQAVRRNLITLSAEIRADSYDETHDARNILETVEQKIFSLANVNQTTKIYEMQELMESSIKMIDMRYKNKGECSGIASGFTKLDSMTSGFQKSEMIVVGARPSMGKTALALSMMQNIAIDKRIPCGFFSLEMSAVQIAQRLLSQVSRVSSTSIRSGMLRLADFQKLQNAAGDCFDAPLYIVDTPNMRLLDLRAMARRMRENQKVEIIFIDYIGLITYENDRLQPHEQISAISKSLKSLARELEIPIVVLCQVARTAEGNEPSLAELRGSGSIEQDADMVMFIHGDRRNKNAPDGEESNLGVLDRKLIVAKQRNGPVGDVPLLFISSCTRFENKSDSEE